MLDWLFAPIDPGRIHDNQQLVVGAGVQDVQPVVDGEQQERASGRFGRAAGAAEQRDAAHHDRGDHRQLAGREHVRVHRAQPGHQQHAEHQRQTEFGEMATVRPSETTGASPRQALSVPSVTMNGLSPTRR